MNDPAATQSCRERNGVERLQSMPVVEMRQLTRSKLELDELRAQLSGLEMEPRNPKPLSSREPSGLGDPVKQRIAEVRSKIEAKKFELRTRKRYGQSQRRGTPRAAGNAAGRHTR